MNQPIATANMAGRAKIDSTALIAVNVRLSARSPLNR
ncbi:Uncharacterised protein [Mycobacterium tuberculosis]|nr:Uncharacterised protein [Mycobacterium tuberculosis]